MYMPTEGEIHAKAKELGLLDGETVSSEGRKTAVQKLLNEQSTQTVREVDQKQLLSRTSTKVDSGTLVVELWHIKGEPRND